MVPTPKVPAKDVSGSYRGEAFQVVGLEQFSLHIEGFDIPGPLLIRPARHGDARGLFSEVFRQDKFDEAVGVHTPFVQDNHSRSVGRGVIRGLHYQAPPFAQGKLLRVASGAVHDVVVDIRNGSPTYGQHVGVELSAENWLQLWVPPGFLHGFCTLTDSVDLLYKVTSYYSAAHDGAVLYSDPDLAIDWPIGAATPVISERDLKAPSFRDFASTFEFQG